MSRSASLPARSAGLQGPFAIAARNPVPLHPDAPHRRPPAPRARLAPRHRALIASFAAMVLAPVLVASWYLWTRAADQYVSELGFAVRSEEGGAGAGLLGGMAALSALSGSSSTDTDILYAYLHTRDLVARVDARLDLETIWSRPARDPVFAHDPAGTIEDLTRYWRRMVRVSYDPGTGLIGVRVHAFAPGEALAIAEAIRTEAGARINALSAVAQTDAIAHAEAELGRAEARLTGARRALMQFRADRRMVDPEADLAGQMGVIDRLQQQLADELVALDLLRVTGAEIGTGRGEAVSSARIEQAERRVAVIRARITQERESFGGASSRDYSALLGGFETLSTDLEFAREAHAAARAAFETARAEARRQSRYLAPYASPAPAERALHPRRWLILGTGTGFALLLWATLVLGAYALRDRV